LAIEPEREKAWLSGSLTIEEAALFFDEQGGVSRKTVPAAVIDVHGGCFLVRALPNGFVEAIPFSIDADGIQEDFATGKYDRTAYWTSQAYGASFVSPSSGTVLADLATLRPWESCLTADAGAARQLLHDLLFGPINDQIGSVLEPVQHASGQELATAIPRALQDAAAITALMAQDFELLTYSQPLDWNGVCRLMQVKCQHERTEDIATALFNAATTCEPAKRVAYPPPSGYHRT
jgi:hypothetical protein